MKRDFEVNRREFMAAGAGLGLSAFLPNVHDSGKSWSGKEVLNPELTCIVKVKALNTYVHVCGETEIHAECRAIDCCMGTYDLRLHFHPATCLIGSEQIIQDLKIDDIYWVRGEWAIADESTPMMIFDPEYWPYEPVDLSEQHSIGELKGLL